MPWAKRILLKSAFTPFTGYGNDGISLAQALVEHGYDVTLSPTAVQPPLPADVAMLFTKPIEPPFDVLLNHADPSSLGLSDGERRSAKQSVAWTMWEFTNLGPGFDEAFGPDPLRTIEQRLDSYDLVMVYDEVSKQALESRTKSEVVKLQGGYDSDAWNLPLKRNWDGPFRFCMVGMLHQRKNPFAAINAFVQLRKEHPELDVELHLKTVVKSLHPKMEETYPGLKIHYVTWTQKQMVEFYHSCHCYLAPSWGEGKNLPALEAMTTGMPVIATEFGGHAEWMKLVNAYPVQFEMGEHLPKMGSARADEQHLKEQMLHVATHREEARHRGELAARTIPAAMDWSKVVARLSEVLGS